MGVFTFGVMLTQHSIIILYTNSDGGGGSVVVLLPITDRTINCALCELHVTGLVLCINWKLLKKLILMRMSKIKK